MNVISPLATIAAPLTHNSLFSLNSVREKRGSMFGQDFKSSVYWRNGKQVYRPVIDEDHTRSSAAYAELLDGSYLEHPVNAARIVSGIGYKHELASTGQINPIAMSALSAGSTTITPYVGTHLGEFNDAITIAGNGTSSQRALIYGINLVNGEIYTLQALVRKGTSGRFRATFRSGADSSLLGEFGSLAQTTSFCGIFSDIHEIDLGDDYVLIQAKFTSSVDDANASLGIGPDTEQVGENIYLIGLDCKQESAFTSMSNGARTADQMLVLGDDSGLNLDAGALFWRGKLGQQSVTGTPRILMLGENNDNSLYLYRSASTNKILMISRSGGVEQFRIEAPDTTDFTFGVTYRLDGSAYARIGGNPAIDLAGYVPPVAAANLYIGSSNSASETINGVTERVVGFAEELTNAEFDSVFAELAA